MQQEASPETIARLKQKILDFAAEQNFFLDPYLFYNTSLVGGGLPEWLNPGWELITQQYKATYGYEFSDTSFITQDEFLEQIVDTAYSLVQYHEYSAATERAILQSAIVAINKHS